MKVDERVFEKIAMSSSFLEYDDCVRILSLAFSPSFIPLVESHEEVLRQGEHDSALLSENYGSSRLFDLEVCFLYFDPYFANYLNSGTFIINQLHDNFLTIKEIIFLSNF